MNSDLRRRLEAIADDLEGPWDAFRSIEPCGNISACLTNCGATDALGRSLRGLLRRSGQAGRRGEGFGCSSSWSRVAPDKGAVSRAVWLGRKN
jgi:hypothetical protein